MINEILNACVLLFAVSIDTFFVCFSYGNSKIKIPLFAAIIIDLICTVFIVLPIILGSYISNFLPNETSKILSAAMLIIIGFYKLFLSLTKNYLKNKNNFLKYKCFKISNIRLILQICYEPEIADIDNSKSLSVKEALMVSVALSLDGITVGIGAGMGELNLLIILIVSVISNFLFIYGGYFIGKLISNKATKDLSWLSAMVIIFLGAFKLI